MLTGTRRIENSVWPEISWTTANVFVVEVPELDEAAVELIAKGSLECKLFHNRNGMRAGACFLNETLHSQIFKAVADHTEAKPKDWKWNSDAIESLRLYVGAAVLLSDNRRVGLAVSWSDQAFRRSWIASSCANSAQAVWHSFEAERRAFEEAMAERTRKHEEVFNDPRMASAGHMGGWFNPEAELARPSVALDKLLPTLRRGIVFDASARSSIELEKAAKIALANSAIPPSRDGAYAGVVSVRRGRGSLGIISWEPHLGPPSYPEVRAAVQARLPTVLKKPRETARAGPEFVSVHDARGSVPLLKGFDDGELAEALEELSLVRPDAELRDAELHEQRKRLGFEAIAWYQSWHTWSEGTWGIYFDAAKLDDLAASIFAGLKRQARGSRHDLAGFIAYGLTFAHENFHARVEAALAWMEMNALQGRYQRYNRGVYQALRGTPDWLEEALANWWAWRWFKSEGVQNLIERMGADLEDAGRLVEAALDLSPPGYNGWRAGASASVRRAFATQLITGKPKPSGIVVALPAESVIDGPLPYDLRPEDVPVRFVGQGHIADRLQSHPASFHVPSRREVEKVLKHFNCVLNRSVGRAAIRSGPDRISGRSHCLRAIP
jgi:hypothetical protein